MEDEMSAKKFPTWGYRRGEAKIFDLGEGERLPAGWYDDPKKAASRAGSEPPWEAPPESSLDPDGNPPTGGTPEPKRAEQAPPKTNEKPKK